MTDQQYLITRGDTPALGNISRHAYADDVLPFNSWRALEAHRPLGSINRLKKQVYDASSRFRHQMNHAPRIEPANIDDLPD